jgi:hypothetical protein
MTHHWKTLLPLGTLTVLGLGLAGTVGCDAVKSAAGAISPPGAEFIGVDLIESPSARELARWGCYEFLGSTPCEAAGLNPIQKSKLGFAFDVVFDLSNENSKIPIPLVEILLATTVYESENLGAVCISFCDPDAEDCTPDANAEGACDAENAEEVTTPADLVPTVDELTEIATDVATGDFDNGEFRVIPAGSSIESHIIFDFNIDTMLSLSEHILLDLGEDLLADRPLEADIPYTMDGTLFFTVPEMGRFGIGFGPVESTWEL